MMKAEEIRAERGRIERGRAGAAFLVQAANGQRATHERNHDIFSLMAANINLKQAALLQVASDSYAAALDRLEDGGGCCAR